MNNTPNHGHSSGMYANRTRARAVVFQILYLKDVNPDSTEDSINEFLAENLPDHDQILKFARTLIHGVAENKGDLDQNLEQKSKNWSLSRMTATDRNILRMSLYEMLYEKTPKAVVIHEAIELAKKFGSADSSAFINGILDQFNP